MREGFIIAAPASGSGKTTLTLGLLRYFRNTGVAAVSFKVGPDYIDPAFHGAASGRPCPNLDCWAMGEQTFLAVAASVSEGAELVVGEGVMGLFDGATDGTGSTADVAAMTGWPVVLVIDAGGQGASAAAVVHGFATYRDDIDIAAVIFNRIGGPGHTAILERACAEIGVPVAGAVPRDEALTLPDRHLGLVQAGEHPDLDAFIDRAAALVGRHVDTAALRALARPSRLSAPPSLKPSAPPLGQRIAVARDAAHSFVYAHQLDGWRAAGAEILPFSPLADEAPAADADAVFLPGGYPELHAGRLAANRRFMDGLRAAAARGAWVYGECGGYMVLGDGLVDGDGERHEMAGLLPVETSFAERRLHLGYRRARTLSAGPLGPTDAAYRGHEFHYATVLREDRKVPLFACTDAMGTDLGTYGCRRGTVAGSFIHLIDRA